MPAVTVLKQEQGSKAAGMRYGSAVAGQLRKALRVLRHPFDVFWEIRYQSRGAVAASIMLLALALIVLLLSKLCASYLFGGAVLDDLNPTAFILRYAIPWGTWVFANYLVGSIMKGQGRLVEVFVGSTYALMPVILFSLPLALLSNLLTFSEGSIYDFAQMAVNGWSLVLLFIMAKEIHNYEIGETVRNIVVSVLLMLAIWLLCFIFAGLTYQLYDFVAQIYKEVAAR
ncbi:YIP1 family protein [Paenibacillus mendelii]|uniref:YIP1 family protein n=1 Tax=Paenibacillus mendelii TaxID=206163 RepID=A0ABV6JDJ4_9BACL|nr:YIP1 family protein [Paenibacillus mendelii]MCQ6563537.1 YIP1 family protein [Paenibacillus mendelii]